MNNATNSATDPHQNADSCARVTVVGRNEVVPSHRIPRQLALSNPQDEAVTRPPRLSHEKFPQ